MNHGAAISRDELRARIERGDRLNLFEVLPEPYYRKHHLPGAIPPPPNDVVGVVSRLVPEKNAEIILYCWDEH